MPTMLYSTPCITACSKEAEASMGRLTNCSLCQRQYQALSSW